MDDVPIDDDENFEDYEGNSEDYDDDEDPGPIRTHTVIDSEDPSYKFLIEEHKTGDFPCSHVQITGVILHDPSTNSKKRKQDEETPVERGAGTNDASVIRHLHQILETEDLKKTTAKNIRKRLQDDLGVDMSNRKQFISDEIEKFLKSNVDKWIEVGKLRGNLLNRDRLRPNAVFHDACDAESNELQGMGCHFCNADGTLRYRNLDGLSRAQDRASSFGNFLHIESVALDSSHRGKGVGMRFLNAVLEWERWTIAGISAGALNQWFSWNGMKDESRQPRTEEEQAVIEDKVCRSFARLGFKQAEFGSEYWYLVPRCHVNPMLPKEAVSHIKRTILNGLTDEEGPIEDLRAVVMGKRIRENEATYGPRRAPIATTNLLEMTEAIKQCIEKGASVVDSCIIHATVFQAGDGVRKLETELAIPLLSHFVNVLDADINALDHKGKSPLHHVGISFNILIARALLEFGADRDLKSKKGATAFDEWVVGRTDDFAHVFGFQSADSAETHRIKFKHALVIAPDDITSYLVDGMMSPRMHLLLSKAAADLCSDWSLQCGLDLDLAQGNSRFYHPWLSLYFTRALQDVIPATMLALVGENISTNPITMFSQRDNQVDTQGRRAMYGYGHVLNKILDLLKRKVFPTPELVRQMLSDDPQEQVVNSPEKQQARQKEIDEYFAVGGFVENALDAVLSRAKKILNGDIDDDEDEDKYDEYFNLPVVPLALDAEKCPGGRGVDFIADLPEELSRMVLMELTPRGLARSQCVNLAWRNMCRDPLHAVGLPEMYELDENIRLVRSMLIGPSKNGWGPYEPYIE